MDRAAATERVREIVAGYRAGIPIAEARPGDMVLHVEHQRMREEALVAATAFLVRYHDASDEWLPMALEAILKEGDVEWLRDPDFKPPAQRAE